MVRRNHCSPLEVNRTLRGFVLFACQTEHNTTSVTCKSFRSHLHYFKVNIFWTSWIVSKHAYRILNKQNYPNNDDILIFNLVCFGHRFGQDEWMSECRFLSTSASEFLFEDIQLQTLSRIKRKYITVLTGISHTGALWGKGFILVKFFNEYIFCWLGKVRTMCKIYKINAFNLPWH